MNDFAEYLNQRSLRPPTEHELACEQAALMTADRILARLFNRSGCHVAEVVGTNADLRADLGIGGVIEGDLDAGMDLRVSVHGASGTGSVAVFAARTSSSRPIMTLRSI